VIISLSKYSGITLVLIVSIAMSDFMPKIYIYSSFILLFLSKNLYINKVECIRHWFLFFYLSALLVFIAKPSFLGFIYISGMLMTYIYLSNGVFIHNKSLVICGYFLGAISIFPIYNIDGRLEGLWGDVNSNAVVAYFISSIILLKIKQKDLRLNVYTAPLLLLHILIIFMSGSRIATIVLSLNYLFLILKKLSFVSALLVLTSYSILFVIYIYGFDLFSNYDVSFLGRNIFDSGRAQLYRYAVDYYILNGFSGFLSQEGIFGSFGVGSAHSTPLSILVELGYVSLLGYFTVLIAMIYYSRYDYSRALIVNTYLLCLFWSSMPFGISAISIMIFIFYFIELNQRNYE
jgi:hypothetical protein